MSPHSRALSAPSVVWEGEGHGLLKSRGVGGASFTDSFDKHSQMQPLDSALG